MFLHEWTVTPKSDLTTNVALRKPAAQSTTQSMTYKAQNAVDGNRGTCTQTLNEIDSWWLVNLEATYEIKEVVITNGGDLSGKSV